MAIQTIDLTAPIGGLHRGVGYQSQSPYFYSDGLNFWSRDVFEQRERGGSRPGLVKAFPAGVTGPVHLLANVRTIEGTVGSTQTHYLRNFNTDLGSEWSQASWKPSQTRGMGVQDGYAFVRVESSSATILPNDGRVLVDLQQSTSLIYTLTITILNDLWLANPSGSGLISGIYSLFARMDNTNPDVTVNGVLVEADFTNSPPTLRMTSYAAGVATVSTAITSSSYGSPQFLILDVTGDVCTARSLGQTITRTLVNTAFGRRVGFGIAAVQRPPQVAHYRLDDFSVDYTGTAPSANRNVIVAAGGTDAGSGTTVDLRFEDNPNVLTTPTAHAITNAAARQLQAAELLGKLYIVGENSSIWEFDPAGAGILALATASAGTMPSNCSAIAAWRTRLCVVARTDTGTDAGVGGAQNISMSKMGAPLNWSYAALPVGSALKLNTTGIDTGKIGEPINSLIAHSDDQLLIGALNSTYVLRGDPTYGGQIDRLSSSIGIVAPQAWARGPNGETVLLSSDGLYGIAPGVSGYPVSLSREPLPQELRDIDVNNYRVLMAYDVRNRGVFIGLSPILGSGGTYWWFDWQKRGFHPLSFNASHEPTALVYRNADSPLDQRLLFGCRDGHIRAMNDNAFSDDGVSYTSRVLIGPIALGSTGYEEGMILEVIGELAEGSGTVNGEVWAGRSIENARKSPRKFPFTLRAGKNRTFNPQLSGNACYVYLNGTPPWGLEKLCIVRERLGKQRL